MHYYRYMYQTEDGSFQSCDQAFESDTQARVNVFTWYINRQHIVALWLFRFDTLDTAGTMKLIDKLERPSIIKF